MRVALTYFQNIKFIICFKNFLNLMVLTTYLSLYFFSAKKYAEHKFEDTFVDEEQAVFEIDGWKYW